MNDNQPPQSTVIDLMAARQSAAALVLPNGVTELLVLGLRSDGTLYFSSEADLPMIFMLLTLAKSQAEGYYVESIDALDGYFDDEPPPRSG